MLGVIAILTFAATLIGGYFALRFRDHLHLILGFSAGAVLGVAFFDLLPEALEVSSKYHEPSIILLMVAIGFLAYLVIDRSVFLHTHEEDEQQDNAHRGIFGASTLSTHSFLDGLAIGIAFQTSPAVGAVVTAAVLTHDFSDGINTVNLILKNGGTWRQAFRWLLVDALAPVVGIFATFFFKVPASWLGLILALFAGCFLYLGASDLIPESHHRHPRFATTFMTLIGAAVLYGAVSLAGI